MYEKPEALKLMEDAWTLMDQPSQDKFPMATALEKVHRVWETTSAGKSAAYQSHTDSDTPLSIRAPDIAKAKPY